MSHSVSAIGQPKHGKDLLIAVMNEDIDAAPIRDPLTEGADINAKDEAGRTALLFAQDLVAPRLPRSGP
jgi:hypothetical protein